MLQVADAGNDQRAALLRGDIWAAPFSNENQFLTIPRGLLNGVCGDTILHTALRKMGTFSFCDDSEPGAVCAILAGFFGACSCSDANGCEGAVSGAVH